MKIEWMKRFRPMEGWGSYTWVPLSEKGYEIPGIEIMYMYEEHKYLVNTGIGDTVIDDEFDTLEGAIGKAESLMGVA